MFVGSEKYKKLFYEDFQKFRIIFENPLIYKAVNYLVRGYV